MTEPVEDRNERFTWKLSDIDIEPLTEDAWLLTYEDNGATVLVQDMDGLMQHLMQEPGFDGNLAGALDTFMATPMAGNMPPHIGVELRNAGVLDGGMEDPTPGPLARTMLGIPPQGDGTARHGYGPPVFAHFGYACAYCGLDMRASFEAWLQLSIDHVIPHQMTRLGYPREWVEDLANLVTCCRPCNDFGNRFIVSDPAPTSPEAFFDLRDQVFVKRLEQISVARAREKRDHFDKLFPTQARRTRARGVTDD